MQGRMFEVPVERWAMKVAADFDVYVPEGENPVKFHEQLSQEKKILLAYLYAEETRLMVGDLSDEHRNKMLGYKDELIIMLERASPQEFFQYAAKLAQKLIKEYAVEDIKSHLEEVYAWVISSAPSAIARFHRYHLHNAQFMSSPEERGVREMVNNLAKCKASLTAKLFFTRFPNELRLINVARHSQLYFEAIDYPDLAMLNVLLGQLDITKQDHRSLTSHLLLSVVNEIGMFLSTHVSESNNNELQTDFSCVTLAPFAKYHENLLDIFMQMLDTLLKSGADLDEQLGVDHDGQQTKTSVRESVGDILRTYDDIDFDAVDKIKQKAKNLLIHLNDLPKKKADYQPK